MYNLQCRATIPTTYLKVIFCNSNMSYFRTAFTDVCLDCVSVLLLSVHGFIPWTILPTVCCSVLPRLGVTDFDHVRFITSNVRQLLGIEKLAWNRSIADAINTPMGMYLEKKSRTGPSTDNLTYSQFLKRMWFECFSCILVLSYIRFSHCVIQWP